MKWEKYFVSEIYKHAIFNAGKARIDIEKLLEKSGYKKLTIDRHTMSFFGKLNMYFILIKTWLEIKKPAIVYFHFPIRSRIIRIFLYLLQRANVYTITHTHDFEGIRGNDPVLLKRELKTLKAFSVIISQNDCMQQRLEYELDSRNPILPLGLYDYLIDNSRIQLQRAKTWNIAFAGNLEKASFISHCKPLKSLKFHIYGSQKDKTETCENITFHGQVHPDHLPFMINGSFGLVWDGAAIDTCSGNYGKYLSYNLPYKLSLYIAAGLPVITWNRSAVASWVVSNEMGFSISSLAEIAPAIDNLSEAAYAKWQQNISLIRKLVIEGAYFTSVIRRSEEAILKTL